MWTNFQEAVDNEQVAALVSKGMRAVVDSTLSATQIHWGHAQTRRVVSQLCLIQAGFPDDVQSELYTTARKQTSDYLKIY